MFDAVGRGQVDIADERVEIAAVEVDGQHRIATQRRVHVERTVHPTVGRFSVLFLVDLFRNSQSSTVPLSSLTFLNRNIDYYVFK